MNTVSSQVTLHIVVSNQLTEGRKGVEREVFLRDKI